MALGLIMFSILAGTITTATIAMLVDLSVLEALLVYGVSGCGYTFLVSLMLPVLTDKTIFSVTGLRSDSTSPKAGS